MLQSPRRARHGTAPCGVLTARWSPVDSWPRAAPAALSITGPIPSRPTSPRYDYCRACAEPSVRTPPSQLHQRGVAVEILIQGHFRHPGQFARAGASYPDFRYGRPVLTHFADRRLRPPNHPESRVGKPCPLAAPHRRRVILRAAWFCTPPSAAKTANDTVTSPSSSVSACPAPNIPSSAPASTWANSTTARRPPGPRPCSSATPSDDRLLTLSRWSCRSPGNRSRRLPGCEHRRRLR
jgi:hypothetical protein